MVKCTFYLNPRHWTFNQYFLMILFYKMWQDCRVHFIYLTYLIVDMGHPNCCFQMFKSVKVNLIKLPSLQFCPSSLHSLMANKNQQALSCQIHNLSANTLNIFTYHKLLISPRSVLVLCLPHRFLSLPLFFSPSPCWAISDCFKWMVSFLSS